MNEELLTRSLRQRTTPERSPRFSTSTLVGSETGGPIGSAVCFPKVVFDCEPLPAAQKHFVIDGVALSEPGGLQRRVEEIMRWHLNDRHRQGIRGAQKLVEALNHDLMIQQPLGLAVSEADRAIVEFSPQQYRLIRLLRNRHRMAVSGPAGSGKTLLALERARDLARSGKRALILCYNRPLADFLSKQVADEDNLEALTCHQLCERLRRKASLPSPSGDQFYRQAAELTLDALSIVEDRYDAVIVDEGQVIESEWWVPIEELLEDQEAGVLWVFYDDNQALYGRPRGLPDGLDHQPLDEVWRNSRPIYEAVMRFYRGDPVDCLGPDGPAVEVAQANGNLRKGLGRVLHRLVNTEHVRTEDIVVLTARNITGSKAGGQVGSFKLVEAPTGPNDIQLSSIYRFLGLEARAVIICEMRPESHPEYEELMYVAQSRARALLVILESNEHD